VYACNAHKVWVIHVWWAVYSLNRVYTIQPVVKRFDNRVEQTATVRSTGCTTSLTTGCIHDTAGCQTGLTTSWMFVYTIGLTTGCIVYTGFTLLYMQQLVPPQKKIITHKDLDSLLQSVVLCGVLRPVCGFQTYRFSENDPFSWTVCKESCRDSWTTNDQYAK